MAAQPSVHPNANPGDRLLVDAAGAVTLILMTVVPACLLVLYGWASRLAFGVWVGRKPFNVTSSKVQLSYPSSFVGHFPLLAKSKLLPGSARVPLDMATYARNVHGR